MGPPRRLEAYLSSLPTEESNRTRLHQPERRLDGRQAFVFPPAIS